MLSSLLVYRHHYWSLCRRCCCWPTTHCKLHFGWDTTPFIHPSATAQSPQPLLNNNCTRIRLIHLSRKRRRIEGKVFANSPDSFHDNNRSSSYSSSSVRTCTRPHVICWGNEITNASYFIGWCGCCFVLNSVSQVVVMGYYYAGGVCRDYEWWRLWMRDVEDACKSACQSI